MTKCTISGCRNLQTTCADCGRIVNTAQFTAPFGEWVSVKDRLPPEGEVVLTNIGIEPYYKLDYIMYIYDDSDMENPKSIWAHKLRYRRAKVSRLTIEKLNVTHWMPLPEEPR